MASYANGIFGFNGGEKKKKKKSPTDALSLPKLLE